MLGNGSVASLKMQRQSGCRDQHVGLASLRVLGSWPPEEIFDLCFSGSIDRAA
jgi:hypothetical protein